MVAVLKIVTKLKRESCTTWLYTVFSACSYISVTSIQLFFVVTELLCAKAIWIPCSLTTCDHLDWWWTTSVREELLHYSYLPVPLPISSFWAALPAPWKATVPAGEGGDGGQDSHLLGASLALLRLFWERRVSRLFARLHFESWHIIGFRVRRVLLMCSLYS